VRRGFPPCSLAGPSCKAALRRPARCQEDVESRMCEVDGCRKQRNFGLRNQRAQRCKAHALAGMVCPTRALHRLAAAWVPLRGGGTQRARAPAGERRHADLRRGRLPDAVLLCLPGAARKAMPGAQAGRHGERVRRAAAACRAPRAAHAHRASTLWRVGQVDVKSKKCEAGGCDKVARFRLPGGRAVRCKAHALLGMVCPGAARLLLAAGCRWGTAVKGGSVAAP